MSVAAALLAELEREAKSTRRVLKRVPPDKLAWRPHPKSMTLGQLAGHIAAIPGGISRRVRLDGMDVANSTPMPPQPEPGADFAAILDAGLAEARELLSGWDEREASGAWRMRHGEREIFAIPRTEVIRTMLLNHWYHHRGQLLVYLRLLDVLVPAVYGRSADETLFGVPPETGAEAAASAS